MAGGWSPTPGFANSQTIGMSTSDSSLTDVATGSTANTKGPWTQLVASTNHDSNWVALFVDLLHTNTTNVAFDFGTGPSGSEQAFISNLECNWGAPTVMRIILPVAIPAGTRLAVRAQSNNTSDIVDAGMILFDSGFFDFTSASAIDTIGWSGTTNLGTPITSGNTDNGVGSYVQLIASTAYDYQGFFLSLDTQVALLPGSVAFFVGILDVAVGPSGSEVVLVPSINIGCDNGTYESTISPPWIDYISVPIPAGSRIAVRVQMIYTESMGVTFYGVR